MDELLTITEAIDVVRRLDARRRLEVSARQLRYWSDALCLGAGRATDGQNAAHLFMPADVALVRLVRRMQRDEVRPRAIWSLLLHQGEALRAACRPGTSKVVWMEPNGRGHLLTGIEAVGKPARECYPLASVVDGVREAVRDVRAGETEIWNGAAFVPVEELVTA